MRRIVVRAYDALLRLYPEPFRSRYDAEMLLDFEDGLGAAATNGVLAVATFVRCAVGDVVVSLVRERMGSGRAVRLAITAAITLLLWGLALRPWSWRWDIQPGPPAHARFARPVTEIELLILALLALVPVMVVFLLARQLARSMSFRRRTEASASVSRNAPSPPGGASTSV
jgi:hypothetical protein